MPELPEVETIRRDLEPRLVGARVGKIWTSGKPLRLARPLDVRALRRACEGRRIVALGRRAKYLLLTMEGGARAVIHLGMSGRLSLATGARLPHTHVVWRLEDRPEELRFVDPRRFGNVTALAPGGRLPELELLGEEPFTMPVERLHELLRGTKRALKLALLDQSIIAGLGNIYVCEALFHAGIHPGLPGAKLSAARAALLKDAIVLVLDQALSNRGTTLRDYVDGGGQVGGNQLSLAVYGRDGEACRRCRKGRIRRVTTQARGTFFCPSCQTR